MSNRISLDGTARVARNRNARPNGALATAATQVQDTISELGHSTAEGLQATRDAAATTLDSAADGLRDTADRVSDLGHETADRVGATAEYIRKRKLTAVLSDMERAVKAHPRKSLLTAAVGGYMIARILRIGGRRG